jgi:hypothetical protein
MTYITVLDMPILWVEIITYCVSVSRWFDVGACLLSNDLKWFKSISLAVSMRTAEDLSTCFKESWEFLSYVLMIK